MHQKNNFICTHALFLTWGHWMLMTDDFLGIFALLSFFNLLTSVWWRNIKTNGCWVHKSRNKTWTDSRKIFSHLLCPLLLQWCPFLLPPRTPCDVLFSFFSPFSYVLFITHLYCIFPSYGTKQSQTVFSALVLVFLWTILESVNCIILSTEIIAKGISRY